MESRHRTKFMSGDRWTLLVRRAKSDGKATAGKEPAGKATAGKEPAGKATAGKEPAGKEPLGPDPDDRTTRIMPAPAPMLTVPFLSKETEELHTRIVMLGSLARCHDPTRAFWESALSNAPDSLV
jgi:hypothetical protein